MTVKQIASLVLDKTSYIKELEAEDSLEAKNRIQNIYELISAIDEFEQKSFDKSLSGYLTQVSLVSDIDELGGRDRQGDHDDAAPGQGA